MKSIVLAVMGLLLLGSAGSAAEVSIEDGWAPGTVSLPTDRDSYSLTQNASLLLAAGIFTCGNVTLGYTTDGWALRRFSLVYEFGMQYICITSVEWGVRRFVALPDSIPNPIQVAVRLYAIPETEPLLFANLLPLDSVMVPITAADNPIAPLTGTPKHTIFWTAFDATGTDLVVAIHYPSGLDASPRFRFSPSGNSLGETMPGYVAFADCGYPEPVTPGELGNTTPMVVMVVNGVLGCGPGAGACCDRLTGACTVTTHDDCHDDWLGLYVPCNAVTCAPPVPTAPKSWGQIKSLYR